MGELTHSICSACGHPNMPGETFCQACGVQLAPVASIPPPPPVPFSASSPVPAKQIDQVPPDQIIGISGKLVVVLGQVEVQLPGGKTEILIGRADPVRDIFPDVDLGQLGGDRQGVSRLHARMLMDGEQLFLEDLNSTNFTFLNNERLQPGVRYPLQSGDKIRLGLMSLEYRDS